MGQYWNKKEHGNYLLEVEIDQWVGILGPYPIHQGISHNCESLYKRELLGLKAFPDHAGVSSFVQSKEKDTYKHCNYTNHCYAGNLFL